MVPDAYRSRLPLSPYLDAATAAAAGQRRSPLGSTSGSSGSQLHLEGGTPEVSLSTPTPTTAGVSIGVCVGVGAVVGPGGPSAPTSPSTLHAGVDDRDGGRGRAATGEGSITDAPQNVVGGGGTGSAAQTPVDPSSALALGFGLGLSTSGAAGAGAGAAGASSAQHGHSSSTSWFSSGSMRSTLSKFGSTSAKKMYEEVRCAYHTHKHTFCAHLFISIRFL